MSIKILSCSMLMAFLSASTLFSAVYYVSPQGNNTNTGTISSPFKTIQKAADVMTAGDTCYARAGIYREYVKPAVGGSSESARIVYKAYPGELPSIRGSEQITTWTQQAGSVWKVDIADSFFGSFNPYTTNFSGEWMNSYSANWHLGDVYLNGVALKERLSQNAVTDTINSWYTSHSGTTTTIYANFNGKNPNTELTEINTREMVFYPTVEGLKYITIDGFEVKHAATNWNTYRGQQKAAIGARWGMYWLIQNCRISDSKSAGITLGTTGGSNGGAITARGHHLIRNNIIERCGENGICASNGGGAVSVIEGNLIQDINYKREIGGDETGGIKMHYAVDVIIRNNIFRRVYSFRFPYGGQSMSFNNYYHANNSGSFPAIWLDWGGMNTRISGNVFSEVDRRPIYLEMNHGPFLVDNNIFIGDAIQQHSERVVLTHNLFLKSGVIFQPDNDSRSSEWFQPHSFSNAGSASAHFIDLKTINNIYVYPTNAMTTQNNLFNTGATVSGCVWDYNVIFQDYRYDKPTEGTHTLVDASFQPSSGYQELTNGIKIGFDMNTKPADVQCPLINSDYFGTFSTVNMKIENPDGSALAVDRDILGNVRNTTHPKAGPFEGIASGANEFTITAGPVKTPGSIVYANSQWNVAEQATPSASKGSGVAYINDRQLGETIDRRYAANSPYPIYVTYNFRYAQAFDKVNLMTQYCQSYGPTSWDVEVSDDGTTNWTKVASSGTVSYTTNNWNDMECKTVTFTQVVKKGVRLKFLTGPSQIFLNEVEVINTSGQPGSIPTGVIQSRHISTIKNISSINGNVSVYDMRGRLIVHKSQISDVRSSLHKTVMQGQGAYIIVRESSTRKSVEKIVISR